MESDDMCLLLVRIWGLLCWVRGLRVGGACEDLMVEKGFKSHAVTANTHYYKSIGAVLSYMKVNGKVVS
jgi:hypothetical protein